MEEEKYQLYIKGLISKRIDVKTESLLKTEFVVENGEVKKTFISIRPKENISIVNISVNGQALQIVKAKDFKIVLPKEFNIETDEKRMDIFLGEHSMRILLNNRYVELISNDEILFVSIKDEIDDLKTIKNGEEICIPRVETCLKYKGNGWDLSATLHIDLENQPIELFKQFYEELEPPTYQLNHVTLLMNQKINDIVALISTENLMCIMHGLVYKINSYDIINGYIQLSRLSVSNFGNNIKSELDSQAMHFIEFLDNKYLLFTNINSNIIFNNILFDDKLEIIEGAPNVDRIISIYETLDVMNSEMISFLNEDKESMVEILDTIVAKKVNDIKELLEAEEELSKTDYVKNLHLIYNYGIPRFPIKIKSQSKYVLDEVEKIL